MGTTGSLSDAFMVFQLGRMTGYPTDRIMRTYGSSKGADGRDGPEDRCLKNQYDMKRGISTMPCRSPRKAAVKAEAKGPAKAGGQGSDGNGKNDQGKGKRNNRL